MTTGKSGRLAAIAVLVALLSGFALARLLDEPLHSLSRSDVGSDGHLDDKGGHAAEAGGDGHARERDEHAGEVEGVVALTARQIEASGITVIAVGRGGGVETRLAGRVESTIDARAAIATPVGGRVERVEVAPGKRVEAGQTLAVLVSGEAAALRAQADAAAAEAESARLVHQRDLSLVEQGVVARQELEASRARSLAADAAARAAKAQVAAAGFPDAEGRLAIASPMAGTVGVVRVAPGGFVASGGVIAEVSDPARTELVFTAAPDLAERVAAGSRMHVTGPTGSLEARVLGVTPDVHERSGAALVRARPLSGKLPPAGTPMAGTLVTDRQDGSLTVPADALQTVDGQAVVFVATDGGFRLTPVLAGRRAGGQVEILSGLSGTERIAGTNAFLLKAELAKGEAGHDH